MKRTSALHADKRTGSMLAWGRLPRVSSYVFWQRGWLYASISLIWAAHHRERPLIKGAMCALLRSDKIMCSKTLSMLKSEPFLVLNIEMSSANRPITNNPTSLFFHLCFGIAEAGFVRGQSHKD